MTLNLDIYEVDTIEALLYSEAGRSGVPASAFFVLPEVLQ